MCLQMWLLQSCRGRGQHSCAAPALSAARADQVVDWRNVQLRTMVLALKHVSLQSSLQMTHLCSSSIVHSLGAAQVTCVGGFVQGGYVLQEGSPHAIQLEDVAVLTRSRLYLQNGTTLILLYHTLQTARTAQDSVCQTASLVFCS